MKAILLAAIALTVVVYPIDCLSAVSPEQAKQCCKTMPCPTDGHAQNCCQTMPTAHLPFVPTPSLHKATAPLHALAVLAAYAASPAVGFAFRVAAAHSHAPPILSATSVASPLRI
jgi:hypothetical protein